jgi:hypothetical protein
LCIFDSLFAKEKKISKKKKKNLIFPEMEGVRKRLGFENTEEELMDEDGIIETRNLLFTI